MSQSIKGFLNPSYYVPKEDKQLKAIVQVIFIHEQKGSLNGHILAIAQAVYSIVFVIFISSSCHLALGSKNVFLNCIHLNLKHRVLKHYNAAMQNLTYSVIATIYVAIGIFIPSVLNGFKMKESQFDDSLSSSRNFPYGFSSTDMSNIQNGNDEHENRSSISFQQHFNQESPIPTASIDLASVSNVQNGNDEHENRSSISFQQHFNQENSISSIGLASGDWLMVPNVESFAIKSTNICTRDMIGTNGINLERQAHRIVLNEYSRILWSDFTIDSHAEFRKIKNWLESPVHKDNLMINALYRTLFYLTSPVAYSDRVPIYTNAKEQYEKYVTSLREVIATEEYQNIRQKSNLARELKDCLILTRALCEARFLSENHGLLHSLLRLHEDEYDRLHPEKEEIPVVTRENFAQVVMAKNKKVKEAPASMKVSATQRSCRMAYGAVGWEDFLMTDIPFLRGKQIFINDKGEERSFYYMRHPTPHIEGSLAWITLGAMSRMTGLGHIESGEVIAPEFEGMLEAIAQRKESYLVQSHQRLNDLGKVENEDSRSQTLYRLQTSHKNFHVVFQAVEGDLFDRKGSYAEITKFTDLKEAIKKSFYIEGSSNRLPACLEEDEEYRNSTVDQLLNQVHQTLFGGRTAISFDGQHAINPGADYPNYEWQAFILAFYILQGDDLKFRLPNVKYFCTNCKNFFDRGGNRAMAEDRLHQEMSKQEVTSEDLEAIIVNLVPVPLQSKGKAVIEKRLKPGLALAEILARLPLEDRQRLQEIRFKEGYKPERFEVSKKEQRAVPLIEDVCTLQEMQEVLRALYEAAQEKKQPYFLNDHKMVQKNGKLYREKDRDHLFHQINNDLKRFEVYVNRVIYTAQDPSNDAEAIFALLKNCGISEELSLQMMAQMQQSIFLEPFSGLAKAFQHDTLGLRVIDSPEKSTIDVMITEDSIEIKAQNKLLYKTTALESSYFRENPIAIFTTKVLVTIPKDGSDANGHWTWEIAEIPV